MSEANMAANSTLSKLLSLNGLCAIYKKEGPTSANVLNEFKETLLKEAGIKNVNPRKRQKHNLKVGHGGTLDSPASGVLVVGVGKGTKMLSSMLTGSKKYTAVAELGKATDTLDATGKVILEKDFDHITSMDIEEKLKEFTGDTMQVPPLYSALKKDGQRMSRLMNTGQKVEAKPARAVTVYNLTLQEFNPPLLTLDIECGGGFYVRSLVDDLGKALSSCAHMKSLVRTKQGQFTLEEHALQEEQWTLEDVMRTLQPCPDTEQNEKHSKDKSKRKCGKKSEEKPDKKSEEKPDKKSEEKPDKKSEEKPDQKSEEKCDNISEEKSEQKSEEDFVKTT